MNSSYGDERHELILKIGLLQAAFDDAIEEGRSFAYAKKIFRQIKQFRNDLLKIEGDRLSLTARLIRDDRYEKGSMDGPF